MVEGGKDLRLENITRRFGNVVAVDNVSLDIPAGQLVALLGPSGCGKTTTLRVIAGFERPDAGRVLIMGRDVGDLPPNRRGLGMVSQDYSLFPHMTVSENVAFGLKMARVPKAEIAERLKAAIDLVQLRGMVDRYPEQLSGGQKQRVALARALIVNPSVLLLDEPLGALDKNLRESMQFELRRIQQSTGITAVMVTHDQEEALTLSDSVAVMNNGKILQFGAPREVYDTPRTRFVSEFLGTANLFDGSVASLENGRASIRSGCDDAPLFHVNGNVNLQVGGKASFAVRPERVKIGEPALDKLNRIHGSVVGRVFRGTHHAYQVQLNGRNDPIMVYRQADSYVGEKIFEFGEAVAIGWNPEDAIVFE